ncbi:MAG: ubiquinol-cytochrome C chaperone family protein [Alphaproteobacteria bacterium]
MFGFLSRRRRDDERKAEALYHQIVQQARKPEFYLAGGVPDTVAGRFDLIALHAFLAMRRLKAAKQQGAGIAQALFDIMFADMDRNLREMGIGDLGVGRRVKAMAKGFYGRVHAYEVALAAAAPEALIEALGRNLYAGEPVDAARMAAMADYLRREAKAGEARTDVLDGRLPFGPPPG